MTAVAAKLLVRPDTGKKNAGSRRVQPSVSLQSACAWQAQRTSDKAHNDQSAYVLDRARRHNRAVARRTNTAGRKP